MGDLIHNNSMNYFHVDPKALDEKLFTIFIGISLGNKLLTPDLAKHYVQWAHEKTDKNVAILIADEIDVINWIVFRGFTRQAALRKTKHKGCSIASMFDKAQRTLAQQFDDSGYVTDVHVIFWRDMVNERYWGLREILEKEYWSNEPFQEKILYFVDKYVHLRQAFVTVEQKHMLAGYILDELPTLLEGIVWNNTHYNLILYPTYVESGMSEFALDVSNGKYFDSAKLQLKQQCALVEDYLKKPALYF